METDNSGQYVMMCLKAKEKKTFHQHFCLFAMCASVSQPAIHQPANIVCVTEKGTRTAEWVPPASIYLMPIYDVCFHCLEIPNLEVSSQAQHVIMLSGVKDFTLSACILCNSFFFRNLLYKWNLCIPDITHWIIIAPRMEWNEFNFTR